MTRSRGSDEPRRPAEFHWRCGASGCVLVEDHLANLVGRLPAADVDALQDLPLTTLVFVHFGVDAPAAFAPRLAAGTAALLEPHVLRNSRPSDQARRVAVH